LAQPNSQPETFSNIQPIQQASAQPETFSNVTPITNSTQPGMLSQAWNAVRDALTPRQVPQSKPTGEMPGSFEGHPENIGEYVPASAGEIAGGVGDIAKGDVARGAHRVIGGASAATLPALPFVAAVAPGVVARAIAAGGAGQYVAKKGAQALGATEDQSDLAGDVGGLAGGYGAGKAPAGRIASTIGKVAKGTIEDIPGVRQVGKVADYWKESAPAPIYPGAPNPETPPDELRQATALFRGSSSPQDPAAGLATIKQSNVAPGQAGQIAESMQKPAPSADAGAGFKRGSLGDLLDQSLGAKKLEPNVPLRKQMPATASAAQPGDATAADLPEGHTPVQSSALSSYKYDPATREFHAKATSGPTTYVYGDVSPEDAQAFEQSDSKGKAWQTIRQNPLVAKIVNGKRIAVKAPQ
jgi:hypothetical protein